MKDFVQKLCQRLDDLELSPVIISDVAAELDERHEKWVHSVRGHYVHELRNNEFLLDGVATDRLRVGFQVIKQIRRDLNLMRVHGVGRRTELQKVMHDKLIASLCPHLFGDEWIVSSQYIMEKLKLKYTKRRMLFACTRRQGKTEGVAMWLATVLRRMPFYTRIVVFGRDQFVSQQLLEAVRKYAVQLDGNERDWHTVQVANHSTLRYSRKGRTDPMANELVAMPGTSGRGVGGQVVVCDEMGFMNIKLIHDTIAALLQVRNTQFIGISSNDVDERNYFNELLRATHPKTKEPLFDVTYIVRLCEECKLAGNTQCNHLDVPQADHIDPEANEAIKAMMRSDPKKFEAEIFGLTTARQMRLYDQKLIEVLEISRPLKLSIRPFFVFSLLDVSGGGSQSKSKSAVVTVAYQRTGEYLVSACVGVSLSVCMCLRLGDFTQRGQSVQLALGVAQRITALVNEEKQRVDEGQKGLACTHQRVEPCVKELDKRVKLGHVLALGYSHLLVKALMHSQHGQQHAQRE